MALSKTRLRANSRRWLDQYHIRLEFWLAMTNPVFFQELRVLINGISQKDCDANLALVKEQFNSEEFSAPHIEDYLFVRDGLLLHKAFKIFALDDKKVRIWIKYAVACLMLANVGMVREDVVHFFWRPIIEASTSMQMSTWPRDHLGYGSRQKLK